jgi:two-component system, NarL family, invasion response regulator UvrY
VIKILVADDHPIIRRGIKQILDETPGLHVGGEASTGPELIACLERERWDVIVLDISMPGGNGIDLIGDVRRLRPEARVLILTVFSEEQYAVRALRAGAAGFLTKESAPDKLVEAVRKIAAGGRYVSPELAEALASMLAGDTGGPPHERLSNREFEVLKMIGSGKTVSEIASELGLSVKTVSTHRTRILLKMNMKTNAELTHYTVRTLLVE